MKKIAILLISAFIVCITVTSCVNDSRSIILAEVTAANLQCPIDMGSGLTMTKVDFPGLYVEYIIKGTEDMIFSQDAVTPEVKKHLAESLKLEAQSDGKKKKFIDALKKENVGIIFHYFNSSGSMDVIVEASDL